jgi:glycosyltransferase involved in cell wall biosynthesis
MNLFFFDSVKKNFGGVERWMLNVARHMSARGHRCYFSGRRGELFLKRCGEEGFQTLPLKVGSDFSLVNTIKLASFFRQQEIDVVITGLNKDTRLCGLARRFSGKTRLIARHGLPILPNSLIYRNSYTRLADGIIAPSNDIKEIYLKYGWLAPDYIRVIHNGISNGTVEETDLKGLRAALNIPEGYRVIGNFGRLVPQKQQGLFLSLGAELLQSWPSTVLMVVGDGPLQAALMEKAAELGIRDSVRFAGFQRAVRPYYALCDLVLHTSIHEGLPNVVMEAMFAAKPVVAFDVGGVRELVPDDRTGLVVKPDDIAAMRRHLQALLASASLRKHIGDAARERILSEFSLEKMLRDVELYLHEICQTR